MIYNRAVPSGRISPVPRFKGRVAARLDGGAPAAGGPRFWGVDAARGVAMIMVALYHLVYDLDFFGGYPVESTSGFWAVFADTSAFAFVFLVGLSLTLGLGSSAEARSGNFRKFLRRGAGIFGYGMAIALVFLVSGLGYVIIGILQLIGLSIILAYPFVRLRLANLALGALVIATGLYISSLGVSLPGAGGVLLAPLGVVPEGLVMPDYRPLLPWFGVVLLGIAAGNFLYAGRKPSGEAAPAPVRPLAFIGRHTLSIYLIHQPVLLAALAALAALGFISL
ncbi:heparan-alpha-glucosaminide N-acetyltransferase [Rubrobacter aplysinae]|uniref:heparan-alpha-glucosaminide N-acetyltransferase n=1 Tax=Rubrobacter aplysinae TaxID=909625 RepID=UPI00069EF3C6|nr:heparan-alpha-glucosaminide N-acetyltransferase [Rubrobacter aplysinae]